MAKKQVKYSPSLFSGQDDKYCFVCGSTQYVQRHEIFFGAYRNKSKEYGLWLNLCSSCHDKTHFAKDHSLDIKLKQLGQAKFEETHTREEFMSLFGKNRLE